MCLIEIAILVWKTVYFILLLYTSTDCIHSSNIKYNIKNVYSNLIKNIIIYNLKCMYLIDIFFAHEC